MKDKVILFYLTEKLFRMSGFKLFEKMSWIRILCCIILVLPYISLIIAMISFCIKYFTNINYLTDCLCPLAEGCMALFKISLFCIQRKEYRSVLKKIQNLSEQTSGIHQDIMYEYNKKNNFLGLAFLLFSICTGIAAICLPLLKMSYAYPYSLDYLSNIILTYLWCIVFCYVIVTYSLCMETLFLSCCFYLSAHFRILQHKVENLRKLSKKNTSRKIKGIIKYHQIILEISDEFNHVCTPAILVLFLSSSFQICVLGYQIAKKFSDPIVIYFSLFLLAVLTQLFLYCYGGDVLQNESTNFSTSIYLGYLYQLPINEKKNLLVSMQRAQKPCKIKPIFFEANLRTLAVIIRTALSYITALLALE